ncbi:hypothetical protein EC991_007605 [Linnemannia zychae]|nr:hypothetical protein EC991_007605 [Linnemannia zychae]
MSARAFSRLHDCNRHMRTHWRIKPYSCPECHRNFVRQDALTRHLRLDFGHNRCSGYPGPLPGNADQGEKDGDDEEEETMEDDEDFPDPDAEEQQQSQGSDTKPNAKNTTNSASSAKTEPSPALPSPTSPTSLSNNKAKAGSASGVNEQERERPLTISTSAANALLSSTPSGAIATGAKEAHLTPRPSDSTQSKFEKEDQERPGRVDPSSPHARHPSSATPMSFVHIADRPISTSEGGKEAPGQPHSRSYPHSAYNYGPATPLTIQTGNMPVRPTRHLERRATAPVVREGEPWSGYGHGHGQGYSQEPISSPVDEYPRGGPGYGGHRHEMDRPRSATHLPPDYPTSPRDIRRSPGPPSAQGDWHPRSGPPSAHWGWGNNPPPPSQDSRLRHPTWSSSSLPPHPQEPLSMQPPHSPVESWPRGHPPASPHDDPRKSSIRSMARYGSSPYPIPEHGSSGLERHHRGSSGPMSPVGPMRPSDPYRRGTSTAEMDRAGSWSEQRSRSFHGAEGMQQDPRSRYDSAGSSLPPASSAMSAGRSPVSAEAVSSSPAHGSERSHSVSGMVGVERMYPPTSVGGGSFHEREHLSASIPPLAKTSGDPNGREYRPARSQSMMDYDAAAMRRSRYAGDPKMVLREERRSMSPPGHRLPVIDTSRPYENSGPRYPYSAGAERPNSGPGSAAMDGGNGGNSYPREEMDEMQQQQTRSGSYYDEPPRSATFQRAPHGY